MGKTKKVGLIARALTCLAATAAIVLGTAFPAFAWDEPDGSVDTSNISVAVPTTIPCTMMADGTVVAPSDLTIVNSGDSVVVDAYTADAMGNAVDFTLDIGGTRALSRTGGKDSAPPSGIDFSSGSKELRLKVSKLDRKINAALQGVVSISGDTTVGSTLTATTSNLQADAKPSYQWYRDGSAIPGATSGAYTTVEADAGHEIICKVTDSSGRYSGALTSTAITPVQPDPVAFAIFSADDGSLNFYKRAVIPKVGSLFNGKTVTGVYTTVGGKPLEEYYAEPNVFSSVGWPKSSIISVTVVDEIAPLHISELFSGLSNCTSMNLERLDTSKVKHMFGVFSGCSSLTNLDGLSEWNTSGVTKMIRMFSGCSSLTTPGDISGWDTSNVSYMSYMFYGCSSLTTLGDISGWDTSKMTNIQNMFADASSLKADCSKWPISEEAWRTRYGFNRNAPGVISPVRQ